MYESADSRRKVLQILTLLSHTYCKHTKQFITITAKQSIELHYFGSYSVLFIQQLVNRFLLVSEACYVADLVLLVILPVDG